MENAFGIIKDYGKSSGLCLNLKKSAVYRLRDFGVTTDFQNGEKNTFLGLPHPFFGNRARAILQSKLLNSIKAVVGMAKYNKLSLITKVEIINVICVPKLLYAGKFFQFTKKFFNSLDSIFTRFMWGSRVVLISRRVMYGSRDVGGLGLISASWLLEILRSNLFFAWLNYFENANIVFPFQPQDRPPPEVAGSDLKAIIDKRKDLIDMLPVELDIHKLSMKIIRKCVLDPSIEVDWGAGPEFFKTLRKLMLPLGTLSFCYKLSHKKLPVKAILIQKYGIRIESKCVFGCEQTEDMNHLFYECREFKGILEWIQNLVQSDCVGFASLFVMLEWCMAKAELLRFVVICMNIWWKMRNMRIFDNVHLRTHLWLKQEVKKAMEWDFQVLKKGQFRLFWPQHVVYELKRF